MNILEYIGYICRFNFIFCHCFHNFFYIKYRKYIWIIKQTQDYQYIIYIFLSFKQKTLATRLFMNCAHFERMTVKMKRITGWSQTEYQAQNRLRQFLILFTIQGRRYHGTLRKIECVKITVIQFAFLKLKQQRNKWDLNWNCESTTFR